ncbi:MAG: mrdB 1 [Bacilli bacterium]|nr:mrdB 1 [Bacilli bacterium]
MVTRSRWKRYVRDFDFTMLVVLVCISFFSLLSVYSATHNNPDLSKVFSHELVWQFMSYAGLAVIIGIDYRRYRGRLQWIGYGIMILLSIAVFKAPAVKGAHSWISLGSFQLQPSEFIKIFIIMTIADFMAKQKENERPFSWLQFLVITVITFVPFVLVYKQPALGQALVIVSIWATLLLLFLRPKILVVTLTAVTVLTSGFFICAHLFPTQSMYFVDHKLPLQSYQKNRIRVFIDPTLDPTNRGYQVDQAKIAVGSGELFGQGLLKGSQTQDGWVPEQQTDFIFSAIAEEFGFIGSSLLIFCFFVLLYRMMRIAAKCGDYFGIFFIYGVMGMFMFQIFENIGMNLVITPSTGITLPFVSYGGSSLLTNFILMGMVFSIGLRRRNLVF